MSYKKMLVIILVVILTMFGLMLTTSYAWYSFEAGSTTFSAVTNNDDIEVTFMKGEYINNTVAVPIRSNDVDRYSDKHPFAIRVKDNREDNEILVTVSLVEIVMDTELSVSQFKVDLYHQGMLIKSFNGTDISVNTELELADVILDDNIDNNLEVRVYLLDDDTDQTALMNKNFQAKMEVNVVSRLKTSITDWDNPDIYISSIKIDGVSSNYLPTNGLYTMSSTCTKGSTLTWDGYSKTITYDKGSYVNDSCSLTFTSSTDYMYLNEVEPGSYVEYMGTNGCDGKSCQGQNANYVSDSNMGYCKDSNYKFTVNGWRVAYIDNTNTDNPKAVIVSAGSPECNVKEFSTESVTYIKQANARALRYCNPDYVDGNCTCTVDADETLEDVCSTPSTDAWAINDNDFYNITKTISGYGKRLTKSSSSLGDVGGTLGTTLYCYGKYSYQECGYNNDLIDDGGYYWFAAQSSASTTTGVFWEPAIRGVTATADTFAFGLRPVISLSSSVYVMGGTGTMDDPYTIAN